MRLCRAPRMGGRLTDVLGLLSPHLLQPGDTAVDATCGNGHDTLTLARALSPAGRVVGFDISPVALEATRRRLEDGLVPGLAPGIRLIHAGHEDMGQYLGPECAKLICFNLGYLPGSDKSRPTRPTSTLAGLAAACTILAPGGALCVLSYTGHPGGREEATAVEAHLAGLDPGTWTTTQFRLLNRPTAPLLCAAWKRLAA